MAKLQDGLVVKYIPERKTETISFTADELILCKSCESYDHETGICTSWGSWTDENGYCYKAEKKDGD